MCCPLVFEFSVGIGGFVIGLGVRSPSFSLYMQYVNINSSGLVIYRIISVTGTFTV